MHRSFLEYGRRALAAGASAAFVTVAWAGLLAMPVAACEVAPATSFESADLVVTGTIVEKADPGFLFLSGPNDEIRWTMTVDGAEKGSVSPSFIVNSTRGCGPNFVVGLRYRVLATVAANGRAQVGAADVQPLDPVPVAVEAIPSPPTRTNPMLLVVWISGLAVAGGVFGTVLQRRRRPTETQASPAELARRARALERAQELFARAAEAVSRAQRARRGIEGLAAAAAAPAAPAADTAEEPAPAPKRARGRTKPRARAATPAEPAKGKARAKPKSKPKPKPTTARGAADAAPKQPRKPRAKARRPEPATG